MELPSKCQCAMLKRMRTGVIWSTLTPDEQKIARGLLDEKLCDVRKENSEWVYCTNERGKAVLERRHKDTRWRWIQLGFTILTAAIALAALVKSFF